MATIVSVNDPRLTPLLDALTSLGMPKEVGAVHLHIEVGKPVTIDCTFYPTAQDGALILDGEAFAKKTATFRLVEVEEG